MCTALHLKTMHRYEIVLAGLQGNNPPLSSSKKKSKKTIFLSSVPSPPTMSASPLSSGLNGNCGGVCIGLGIYGIGEWEDDAHRVASPREWLPHMDTPRLLWTALDSSWWLCSATYLSVTDLLKSHPPIGTVNEGAGDIVLLILLGDLALYGISVVYHEWLSKKAVSASALLCFTTSSISHGMAWYPQLCETCSIFCAFM